MKWMPTVDTSAGEMLLLVGICGEAAGKGSSEEDLGASVSSVFCKENAGSNVICL